MQHPMIRKGTGDTELRNDIDTKRRPPVKVARNPIMPEPEAKKSPWGKRGSDAYRDHARKHMQRYRNTSTGRANAKTANDKYRNENRKRFNKARRNWLNRDQSARIADRTMSLLRSALKDDRPNRKIWTAIGCSCVEFKAHLEALWKQGMNWENFGTEWCVSLVVSKRRFDFTTPAEVVRCFHTDNVRPAWKKDILGKGGLYRVRLP